MVEADFVERGRRRERRDVAADALFRLVRAHHHRRGVPADQALDAALEVGAAGHRHLLVGGNGVDVGRVGGERQLDAVLGGVKRQLAQQPRDFDRAAALQHIIEGLEPFARFDGVELRRVFRSNVSHGTSSFRIRPSSSTMCECRLTALCRPITHCNRAQRKGNMLTADLRRRCCRAFVVVAAAASPTRMLRRLSATRAATARRQRRAAADRDAASS